MWLSYFPSTQDTRVLVTVLEEYVLSIFTALLFLYSSATEKHTLFTHSNRGNTELDYDIHLLITHILIHTICYYH